MPEELFTFETAATLTGAAFLTFAIVSYTKGLVDRFWHVGTDLYAVLVGFVVLLLSRLALGDSAADWRVYVLAAFNGFVVALTAGQLHNKTLNEAKKKE